MYPPGSAPPGSAPPLGLAPLQRPKPWVISRGLALCIAAVLLQIVLIIYRSDSLAKFTSLESAAVRASTEKSALVAEREKSEREREKMRNYRELLKKLEDRVPQGALWEPVQPAQDCRAYGKREYWGALSHIPEDWDAFDACMHTPVEISGVTVRRPYRCAFVDGSPYIHGYWMVDWGQPDCTPRLGETHDVGCTNRGSGVRRIEAPVIGTIGRKERDWWSMCGSIPFTWNRINYTSPTHCEDRNWGKRFAVWDVPDESCL